MEKVRILGIVGSPRKNGNTAKLVKKALEGASSVSGVETELYEMAGKEFHHCIGCFHCLTKRGCRFKDDFQDFVKRYLAAHGVIWGAPVYHMGVPGLMKGAIDRLSNALMCTFINRGKDIPRFGKVCGVLTVGGSRYGGQDLVLAFLVNSCLMMNGVVVSGDSVMGNYIGAAAYTGAPGCVEAYPTLKDQVMHKGVSLKDQEGVTCVINLGKRVAETTRVVRAGMLALEKELPSEYFYRWEELGWE